MEEDVVETNSVNENKNSKIFAQIHSGELHQIPLKSQSKGEVTSGVNEDFVFNKLNNQETQPSLILPEETETENVSVDETDISSLPPLDIDTVNDDTTSSRLGLVKNVSMECDTICIKKLDDPYTCTVNQDNINPPNEDSAFLTKIPVPVRNKVKERKIAKSDSINKNPYIYQPTGPTISNEITIAEVPNLFKDLEIHSESVFEQENSDILRKKLRKFVGDSISDEQFKTLECFCSPSHLLTGSELKMETELPVFGVFTTEKDARKDMALRKSTPDYGQHLHTLRRLQIRQSHEKRMQISPQHLQLKYRSVRLAPIGKNAQNVPVSSETNANDCTLVPGRDLLIYVRIYRPYPHEPRGRINSGSRHPMLVRNVILLGQHRLSVLRDHIACPNDIGMRADCSLSPHLDTVYNSKTLFPSGFLFINNVFYNDFRAAECKDYSAPIRAWARRRKIGEFPHAVMENVRLDQLKIRLGYPEVYVHQGNCEHLFSFSDIRLLGPTDPNRALYYPLSTQISIKHVTYCTTCANFTAKWVVRGSNRVPFDPAFICDSCLQMYFYKDGNKIGDFLAYPFHGNDSTT